ncbi:hypothetical protein AOC36_07250 [Erysipelothrix larvae]|uniref:HTH cro/C1-type domain-containing protein n=1 Tax=Erysipelothrix larvae TaxID=1514105 RepID=A0A0X8H0J0_9FIRM|nr:helix-turn-helix transcriptional regulator [Erysipelothrix larvae]AMC93785.1 hypothetical protein AOC36_07250 [Erysipelothrix larvae]
MTTYNFSTIKLGKSISRCRKEKNLTQGELAELLGVSHQAVSSWENGLTCPDISKLSELSRIFEVSIDTIFEHKSVGHIIEKVEQNEPLEEEELIVVAPLTKPQELDSIIDKAKTHAFKLETMVGLAPFAQESQIEAWIDAFDDETDLEGIVGLAPFISSSAILKLIQNQKQTVTASMKSMVGLAPFLDEEDLDTVIQSTLLEGSLKDIVPLAPFASEETLTKLIEDLVDSEDFSLNDCVALAPFLSENDLDLLLKKASSSSMRDLVPLAPFIGEETLSNIVKDALKEPDFKPKELIGLAPFLDRDVIKEIIELSISNGNLEDVSGLFPFM